MNYKKKKIDFSTPIIMGILNLSNNSFYDGGRYVSKKQIIDHVQKMMDHGAQIIDIGAESSKPGSEPITEQQELSLIIPTIKLLKQKFNNITISIDTYKSRIAKESINQGADIINDISAGEMDKNMFNVISESKTKYVMMHMKGNPKTMQESPNYSNIIKEIIKYFDQKIKKLNDRGFNDIIIEPGFGFGKTLENNYKILNNIKEFTRFDLPIMSGISRKSMIYNVLNNDPSECLNGTSVLNTLLLNSGVNIIRVHDVKEAMECIKITNFVNKNK